MAQILYPLVSAAQSFTDTQKAQALTNIGAEDATEFIKYSSVLTFIDHGMFFSTSEYLKSMTFTSSSLEEIRLWLITVLTQSDSVGN